MKRYLFSALLCLLTGVPVGPVADARAIEFETTQVTQADVALSPDGQAATTRSTIPASVARLETVPCGPITSIRVVTRGALPSFV